MLMLVKAVVCDLCKTHHSARFVPSFWFSYVMANAARNERYELL